MISMGKSIRLIRVNNVMFYLLHRYAGANHEDEMIYVLGIPEGRLDFYFQIQPDDQASLFKGKGASWDSSLVFWNDINLSLKMMEYWTNFVKTG